MTDKIIKFPNGAKQDNHECTREEYLVELHQRLYEVIAGGAYEGEITLDVTDVTELMQLIEEAIGPEWFDGSMPELD